MPPRLRQPAGSHHPARNHRNALATCAIGLIALFATLSAGSHLHLAAYIAILTGVAVLFWIAFRMMATPTGRCPHCDDDLTGLPPSSPCPECGRSSAHPSPHRGESR